MKNLLEQAFREAQKLPDELQDEVARQLLKDIQSELKWQETLADSKIDISAIQYMAQAAIIEDDESEFGVRNSLREGHSPTKFGT
ncbi:MAG: hypothetical protein AAGE59_31030 [Cyanobacteria bacterium P01_F01_bin.86]